MPDGQFVLLGVASAVFAVSLLPSAGATQWRVDASVGSFANEALADDLDSNNLIVGVRRSGANWLYVTTGLPLDAVGSSWGAAGVGTEIVRRGGVDVGVAGNLEGWAFGGDSASGWGAIGEIGPFARAVAGPITIDASSGVVHHRAPDSEISGDRTLSASRLGLSLPTSGAWEAGTELRYLHGQDGGFAYVGTFLSAEAGAVGAWGRGGHWLSDRIPRPEWSAGVYLSAAERVRLEASVRQDTNDPLFWTEPRRSWTVGVSYAVSPAPSTPPLLPLVESGRAVIRIPVVESPDRPLIAGDFSGWQPIPMSREGGFWTVAVPVRPGVYHYSFRTADGRWFLPPSTITRVDDGFGGENGVLVVQ
ncbi:MAG: glycogen-binding domain-containing protein [Gemmatimonadota bacterium]